MAEYRIGARSRTCAATDRPFEEGDVVVTAIYEDAEQGFVRKDFCEEGFEGAESAEAAYSVWRSRIPVSGEEAHGLDFDLAQAFLEKLIREADPEREGLAYVLVLLLSRKRRVKIKASKTLPDGELLTVLLRGAEEDQEVQLHAPRLGAEDVRRLQVDLARLFGFAGPEEPPAEAGET